MSNTTTTRTNGNGVPRGWHRFSARGTAYYWGKDRDLTLRKYGTDWQIRRIGSPDAIATGTTMAEATANMLATAKPAKITSTVTLPDGRVETRTGKNAWPFAVCSPSCYRGSWGVFRWSRTREAAEKFQAWCAAQGGQMILIETEVG